MATPAVVNALQHRKAVVAKLGMDAHWRGAIVVAHALRDAGAEVVYLGHATADEIAAAVSQEDADLVGLSTLSGNHLTEVPAVVDAMRAAGADALVVAGGAIPPGDARDLAERGVDAVFPTGSTLRSIVERVSAMLADRDVAAGASDA